MSKSKYVSYIDKKSLKKINNKTNNDNVTISFTKSSWKFLRRALKLPKKNKCSICGKKITKRTIGCIQGKKISCKSLPCLLQMLS